MRKVIVLLLLICPLVALSVRPDCGRGEVDCVGLCARFIDENGDTFCDIGGLSEATLAAQTDASKADTTSKPYRLILVTSITLGLYFLSALLKRFNLLTKGQHRKIWNVLLLITFFISGILGLVLVVQLNYNVLSDWFLPFLTLHVEFGIAMALISIIHAWWHIGYYAKAFGLSKTKQGRLSPNNFRTKQSA